MNNICVQYYKILGVATRWTVRGSNPVGGIFSGFTRAGPEIHPASCTAVTRSLFQRQSVRGVALIAHPHSRLTFPPAVPARHVTGQPLPFTLYVYLFVVSTDLRPLILHGSRHFCHIY